MYKIKVSLQTYMIGKKCTKIVIKNQEKEVTQFYFDLVTSMQCYSTQTNQSHYCLYNIDTCSLLSTLIFRDSIKRLYSFYEYHTVFFSFPQSAPNSYLVCYI